MSLFNPDTKVILSDSRIEEMYCDMLDECYPDCRVAGYNYATSHALAKVDPIAFDCGLADYQSSLYDEGYTQEVFRCSELSDNISNSIRNRFPNDWYAHYFDSDGNLITIEGVEIDE